MGKTLTEIAKELKDSPKKVQLIYAFNGTGKTRLSREFKDLISNKDINGDIEEVDERATILYYNAFTEDLFHWDNDLEYGINPVLKIKPNSFTKWVLEEEGQDINVITNFQKYTNEKLVPAFNQEYLKDKKKPKSKVDAFTEVTFSFKRGNDEDSENIKISKGEESNFIWSIFYCLLEQLIDTLDEPETDKRNTNKFDNLEYIFIDDPVSSLDENHLISLAVDLAQLIKSSESNLKFIITTHNPLFYNVLWNEFNNVMKKNNENIYKPKKCNRYRLKKLEDEKLELISSKDSPFAYHLYLKSELEKAVDTGEIYKYHFNFVRNILEKTSTFLGFPNWEDLLPKSNDGRPNPYKSRILNISSHSKHSGEEVHDVSDNDKRVLGFLVDHINKIYDGNVNYKLEGKK
ncbi:AAA family ATPase [Lentisphaerota bacterium WC36G]|nr:AAA family ATPase [Lentisphaerae bacterium WC36]